jgi:hypothetical protein
LKSGIALLKAKWAIPCHQIDIDIRNFWGNHKNHSIDRALQGYRIPGDSFKNSLKNELNVYCCSANFIYHLESVFSRYFHVEILIKDFYLVCLLFGVSTLPS